MAEIVVLLRETVDEHRAHVGAYVGLQTYFQTLDLRAFSRKQSIEVSFSSKFYTKTAHYTGILWYRGILWYTRFINKRTIILLFVIFVPRNS